MNRLKLLSVLCAFVLVFSLQNANAFASSVSISDPDSTCKQIVNELIVSENAHDWSTFCSLFTKDQADELKPYFDGNSINGVKGVKSAVLREVQPLNQATIADITKSQLKSYIVGTEYNVNNEDKYFFNGVNYRLVTFQYEGDSWKISDYADAPLEQFIPTNQQYVNNNEKSKGILYALPNLNSDNVKTALDILDARVHGIIINAKGEYLSSNNPDIKSKEDAQKLLSNIQSESLTSAAANITRPIWVNVSITNYGTVGWDFLDYASWVLPNEWGISWPAESLKAGALCVMQWGAYAVLYHPMHPSVGADACDKTHCQIFIFGTNTTSTDNAISAVKNYYYVTSSGTFFQTCYAKGLYESSYGHSGRMRQDGSHYWADNGKTWTWMMDYYYTNSNYNIPITTITRKTW